MILILGKHIAAGHTGNIRVCTYCYKFYQTVTQQGAQSQNPENQENDEDDILSSSPNINRSLKILDYNTLKIYQIFFQKKTKHWPSCSTQQPSALFAINISSKGQVRDECLKVSKWLIELLSPKESNWICISWKLWTVLIFNIKCLTLRVTIFPTRA